MQSSMKIHILVCLLIGLVFAQNETSKEEDAGTPEDAPGAAPRPIASYSILQLSNGTQQSRLCSLYFPHLTQLPLQDHLNQTQPPLLDLTPLPPCSLPPSLEVAGSVVMLRPANACDVVAVAARLQHSHGAYGSILLTDTLPDVSAAPQGTWLLLLANATLHDIGDPSQYTAAAYTVPPTPVNWSLAAVWLIAVSAVLLGGCWSGYTRHTITHPPHTLPITSPAPPPEALDAELTAGVDRVAEDGVPESESPKGSSAQEPPSINMSPLSVVVLVAVMCGMLVALYYLYDYLVYVILGLFTLATIGAVYDCLFLPLSYFPLFRAGAKQFEVYRCSVRIAPGELILLASCISLSLTWFFLRKEPYAWILQDILGYCFTIQMIKNLRISTLRTITLLLTLLFFYDVFFVFITPLLTPSGDSIMVAVAKGGDGGEELPMVFKVPHFGHNEIVDTCQLPPQYNLLGFGDILVPGLLIGLLNYWDRLLRGALLYTAVGGVAYGAGLLLTFAALLLTASAQPALLYLVPCCLGAAVVAGAARGHLRGMWGGEEELSTNEMQRLQ